MGKLRHPPGPLDDCLNPLAEKGKTPAEAAGIEIKGENKWLTIIQNAKKAASND